MNLTQLWSVIQYGIIINMLLYVIDNNILVLYIIVKIDCMINF